MHRRESSCFRGSVNFTDSSTFRITWPSFHQNEDCELDDLQNASHKWSPEQVVTWLQTIPIPLDDKQQLINANGLTGDVLPSILLSASVLSGLNESSFALLEERIFRLILFNWYPTLPLEAVVCATFCVFIVLYTSRLIIALDLSAFLANFERFTHLERCRSRLRTIKSRYVVGFDFCFTSFASALRIALAPESN
ncbi:unnamed protein product [Dicrocoelium dendriticum]|nr:unnamed protein product [Dicrocoelium dendriticum]